MNRKKRPQIAREPKPVRFGPKPYRKPPGQKRNDRCQCGSGAKFKRCCRLKPEVTEEVVVND